MKYRLSIRVKKLRAQTIANMMLYYTLFIGFFIYNFGLPESFLYVGDCLNVVLTLLCLRRLRRGLKISPLKRFVSILIVLLVVSFLSALNYGVDLLLIVWSLRNWGRGICFFLICCCILKENQNKQVIEFSKKLFHINTIVILIQYLFLRSFYSQDALNGLVGRSTSTVSATFLMIVLSIVLAEFFTKNSDFKELLLYLIEYNVVCVVAELRALMLFEIVFVAFYTVINYQGSPKQLIKNSLLFVFVLIGASFAASYLVSIYPEFAGFFSLDGLLYAANNDLGYGYSGYIDRFNFITIISNHLFKNSPYEFIFGIGLGNGEYSAVPRLCSNFYNTYGSRFAYLRFSSAMIFLESGIVGFTLFIAAHITLFAYFIKTIRSKRRQKKDCLYDEIGAGVILTALLFLFYNNVHRTDISFILAFYGAIPISMSKYTREKSVK